MKPWMLAAMSGAPELVTLTITSSQNVTIPFGVSRLETASGSGARGQDATAQQNYIFETQTIYATRRSDGATIVASQSRYVVPFWSQSAQCGPLFETPSDPTYSSNQTCYTYDGFFTVPGNPATTGASATGFGRSFPGSTGNVQPAVTTFDSVPVTGGQSYSVFIPSGGSITITYYK